MAVATIHEARFVVDDDTRLLFATSFDSRGTRTWRVPRVGADLGLFDAIFQHVEGYEGLPDLAALPGVHSRCSATAAAYTTTRHNQEEIRKARW